MALLILAAGLFAGCSGGSSDDTPFEGNWVAEDGSRIFFSGSSWSDSDGDSGEFEFTGEYPVFEITFFIDNRFAVRRATFADTRTMELCTVFSDQTVGACIDLVLDRPTLH
jgi:hypothetical protein